MTQRAVKVGEVVRVDEDTRPWRVTARVRGTGMLTLESLNSSTRIVWAGVQERRVQKSAVYR